MEKTVSVEEMIGIVAKLGIDDSGVGLSQTDNDKQHCRAFEVAQALFWRSWKDRAP